MRQDVRLYKYYYGCSRGSSVLLIVRVAQVSYLCHYYDSDLPLGNINIYPPCLILNFVYITSPQQPNYGRPLFSASLARPRSPHRTLRRPGRSRRGCDRAGRTESSSARFGQLSTSSPIRCASRLAVLPMSVRICWFHPKAKSQSSRMRSSCPE